MARKDEVAAYTDKHTHVTEHINLIDKIYVVCYEKCPIEIRIEHLANERVRHKRTIFTSKNRAHTLAEKLNTRYKTDRFTVEQLIPSGSN